MGEAVACPAPYVDPMRMLGIPMTDAQIAFIVARAGEPSGASHTTIGSIARQLGSSSEAFVEDVCHSPPPACRRGMHWWRHHGHRAGYGERCSRPGPKIQSAARWVFANPVRKLAG